MFKLLLAVFFEVLEDSRRIYSKCWWIPGGGFWSVGGFLEGNFEVQDDWGELTIGLIFWRWGSYNKTLIVNQGKGCLKKKNTSIISVTWPWIPNQVSCHWYCFFKEACQLPDWQTYKKYQNYLEPVYQCPVMSSKNSKKISHPDLEIYLCLILVRK